MVRPPARLPCPAAGDPCGTGAFGGAAVADPGDRAAGRGLRDRRALARASGTADRGLLRDVHGHHRRVLGDDPGPALPLPVGGAADAGGHAPHHPHHNRLRAARPPDWVAAYRRPLEPGDADRRGGEAGLRRRRDMGRHMAGPTRAGRATGGPRRPGTTRHAPNGGLTRFAPVATNSSYGGSENVTSGPHPGTKYLPRCDYRRTTTGTASPTCLAGGGERFGVP